MLMKLHNHFAVNTNLVIFNKLLRIYEIIFIYIRRLVKTINLKKKKIIIVDSM